MNKDEISQVLEEGRKHFIEESILSRLPEDQRDSANQRATKIINDYLGREVDTLSVLAYAAEQGRFEEFATKLEGHYKENLQYVHPSARRLGSIPGARRAEVFFLDCYQALKIKPRTS